MGVVPGQPTHDAGEIGVVRRATDGPTGGAEAGERHVEDVEAPGEAAPPHERRRRLRHRLEQAADRRHQSVEARHGGTGELRERPDEARCGVGPLAGGVERQLDGRGCRVRHRGRRKIALGGVGVIVEDQQRQLHPADPVGQRVVDLLDERRPAVGHPLDERELPQRSAPVEAGHGRRLGHVEHGAQVTRERGSEPDGGGTPGRSARRRPSGAVRSRVAHRRRAPAAVAGVG